MRLFLLLTICTLYFSLQAIAQSSAGITGRIINRMSQPVHHARIELLNKDASAYTDSTGTYHLAGLGNQEYEARISAPGYADQYIRLSAAESAPVTLYKEKEALDEVIVLAEKKEENLQQVPLSVSVLSSKAIEDYQVWNTGRLSGIIPSLYAADPGDGRYVTSIRGITSTSYDPAVTTYIDGVSQFSLDTYMGDLLDVERIEVLRGPQSTLYGRNAMGGIINIITKQPAFRTSGFLEATVGNYSLQRYRASFRTPLTKKLLFGAALMYNSTDGYYTNEYNNTHFDKQSSISGNYFLKYLPNAQWTVLLNVKHQYTKNNGAFPLAGSIDEALQHPFRLNQNTTSAMNDRLLNASLSVRYSGTKFQLVSETGYQSDYRIYSDKVDADFSPLDAIAIYNNYGKDWNNVSALTQEIRVSSPASASQRHIQWVAGTYLFYQHNPVKQATVFGHDAPLLGMQDSLFRIVNTSTANNKGASLFGQITVPVLKGLNLVCGLRYDYQQSELAIRSDYQSDAGFGFNIQPDTSAHTHYSAFSPHAGLLYAISNHQNLYVNYSRGFRTGGFTQLSADPSQPALYPYQPEYSSNIEAGLKNTFFSNRLRVNLAVYYTRVKDIQIPALVLPAAITITKNGGELESKGAEAEVSAALLNCLSIQYNFGYTDARYTSLTLPVNGTEVNLEGKRQIFTPDVTSSLALQYQYTISKAHKLDIIVRGEWMYLGRQYFDQANQIMQAPYNLLNIKLGLRTPAYSIMAWGRNLSDIRYIDYAYTFGGVHLGDPLTFGITLSARLQRP